MNERFLFPVEYHDYHIKLGGLRKKVASSVSIPPGARILDVCTGCGYFAVEIAARDKSIHITGIDGNEAEIEAGKGIVREAGFEDQVQMLRMDMSRIEFPNERFDIATTFLGIEDIYITRGKDGLRALVSEVSRVLKQDGMFYLVVMPPEEMESEAQRLEMDVYAFIFRVNWLSVRDYSALLEESGFDVLKKTGYYTERKLTPEQAKHELKDACINIPKIYGRETPMFQDVWKRYGHAIEKYGLGHCSKVVMITSRKIRKP